jgi:hypothetical protein
MLCCIGVSAVVGAAVLLQIQRTIPVVDHLPLLIYTERAGKV